MNDKLKLAVNCFDCINQFDSSQELTKVARLVLQDNDIMGVEIDDVYNTFNALGNIGIISSEISELSSTYITGCANKEKLSIAVGILDAIKDGRYYLVNETSDMITVRYALSFIQLIRKDFQSNSYVIDLNEHELLKLSKG